MLATGCIRSNSGELDGSKYVADWHENPVRGGAPPLESSGSCTLELGSETGFLEEAILQEVDVDLESYPSQIMVDAIPKEYYGQAELGDHYSVFRVLHLRSPPGAWGNTEPEVIQKPTIAFQDLVDVTPRAVLRNAPDSSQVSDCELPVYVKDTYIQHD